MKLLKFVQIRISFQVNSIFTERGAKMIQNYCMQQNVVEWRDSVRFAMARFILETDHPSGTNLGKER